MLDTDGEKLRSGIGRLPAQVQAHIEEVRVASVALARTWKLDVDKAELAALAHDVCRVTPAKDLLRMAVDYGLPITAIDRSFPVFLHGPVGAEVLRRGYRLMDDSVLDPIRYHTMGREDMTALDKVLFLADKLDPSKVSRYPFIGEVARIAHEDLDRAMLLFIDNQVKAFIDHGDLVHPGMIAARNSAVLATKGR